MNVKESVQGYDISAHSAAVLGCGGLGTNVAVHLAGSGIGQLILCDFDTVEERNLNRQFFYTPADVGKPKARLLAQRLACFAPDCDIRAVERRVETPDDLSFADGAELLILAVDNVETRRTAGEYCARTGKPCVNGGVNGFFGTAYLWIPGETPPLEQAGALLPPQKKPLSPSPAVGVIGALQAKLAVDYFLHRTASQGMLLCYDGLEIQALPLKL